MFAVLLCCCCTFIYTIPSTSKVRTHGNELYTRGTPAQTRNIKRGKERKRAVIIGLLWNRGMLKRLSLLHILKKKNPNKLRYNAVTNIYFWLPEHSRVPQGTEVTLSRQQDSPRFPQIDPHRQVHSVREKLLLVGRDVFGENKTETHQIQFYICNQPQLLC